MQNQLESENDQPRIPFYQIYLSKPPIFSSILASMFYGIEFKPMNVSYSESEYCKDIVHTRIDRPDIFGPNYHSNACTSMSFNSEWWNNVFAGPILGFVVAASVTWAFVNSSKYVMQSYDNHKNSYFGNKIVNAINFSFNKIDAILPKDDSIHDTFKFTVLSSAVNATYGLIGAACLSNIDEINDAKQIAVSQALGGFVLPAIGVGLLWGYRAVNNCSKIIYRKQENQELDTPLISANGEIERPYLTV